MCIRDRSKPDRFENRIEQVGYAPRLEPLDAAIHRVERCTEVRNHNDASAGSSQLSRHVDVGAVDTEDQFGACLDGLTNLVRVERVDADAELRSNEVPDNVPQIGKRETGRAADVDDVR